MLADSKFLKHLRAMARVAGRDLGADGLELYKLLVLDEHGDEASSAALLAWVRQNTRSGFPTPGELLAILQPEAAPKSQATEIANRLIAAISRRGYTWVETCRYDGHASHRDALVAEFGEPVANFVERCGGWREFCRQYGGEDAVSTLRAQLRDALEGVVVQHASQQLLEASKPKAIEAPRDGKTTHVSEIIKRVVA